MKRKRCAIVMGATSGIGMEVALLLAKRGWKVGIAGRREERLCRVMDANKGIAVKKQIDVTALNAWLRWQKSWEAWTYTCTARA